MKKPLIVVVIVLMAIVFFHYDLERFFSLNYIKEQNTSLRQAYNQNKVSFVLEYLALYIISTALSFPGATILTLAAGAIFGLFYGTIYVTIASTLGATLAFLAARYLLRDFVQRKFHDNLIMINKGIAKDGAFYLFSLRVIPVVPFFVINMTMGLTEMKTWTFFWISLVGMILGTVVYVQAGTELVQITSAKGLLSPSLILLFILVGILPFFAKKLFTYLRTRKKN